MNRLKRWLRYWLRLEVLSDDDEMVDLKLASAAFVLLTVLIIIKGLL